MSEFVIKKVVVTEKAYNHPGALVVNVDLGATKDDVKKAFAKLYGDKIEIKSVRINKLPMKSSSRRKVKRPLQKRAYIYLKNKEGFDFLTFNK